MEPELDGDVLGERNVDLEGEDDREACGDDVDETETNGETDACADAVSEPDKAGLREEDVLPVDERDIWPEREAELDIDVLRDAADDDDGDLDDGTDRETLGEEDALRVISGEWLVVIVTVVVRETGGEPEGVALVKLDPEIRPEIDDVAVVLVDGELEALIEYDGVAVDDDDVQRVTVGVAVPTRTLRVGDTVTLEQPESERDPVSVPDTVDDVVLLRDGIGQGEAEELTEFVGDVDVHPDTDREIVGDGEDEIL